MKTFNVGHESLYAPMLGRIWFVLCLLVSLAGPVWASEDQSLHLRYGFTLRNQSAHLLTGGIFHVYGPVMTSSTQRVIALRTEPEAKVEADVWGNTILTFPVRDLAPFAATSVRIDAEVVLLSTPEPQRVEEGTYLDSSHLVEVHDPALIAARPSVTGGRPDEIAARLGKWVSGLLELRGYDPEDRGSAWALANRRGDCTEYAALLVASLRSVGVPARLMGGYWCSASRFLRPQEYHNWAEYYQDGVWRIADPYYRVYPHGADQYIAFRVVDDGEGMLGTYPRFRCEGDGLVATMQGGALE